MESIQSGTQPNPVPDQQQQQQQPIGGRDTTTQQNQGVSGSINQQFVELGSRLQLINHASNNLIRDIANQNSKAENRHNDLIREIHNLDARTQKLEQSLQNIQRDLEGKDYRDRFAQLQDTLRSSHLSLSENLQENFIDGKVSASLRGASIARSFLRLLTNFQISYYRLDATHGLFHHHDYRGPVGPRWLVHYLQASAREHAQEVSLNPFSPLPEFWNIICNISLKTYIYGLIFFPFWF